jgi:hypothetical protein
LYAQNGTSGGINLLSEGYTKFTNTTGEIARFTQNGNFGIGTTSPYAALSVSGAIVSDYIFATSTTATSTFAGSFNVGNGSIFYDNTTGTTSIPYLEIGNTNFAADSGVVSWMDMPVTSTSASGVINSYTASLNGNPMLTVFGASDGAGGVNRLGVGIGTTSPFAKLTVWGNDVLSTSRILDVANSASSSFLTVFGDGAVRIGSSTATTTINGYLDVLGTGANSTSTISSNLWIKGALKIGLNSIYITDQGIFSSDGTSINFNNPATSSFMYSSSTMSSVNTLCLNGDCRSTWPTSTGGGGSAGGTWSTTTSQVSGRLVNYSNNNTDIISIGANATTSAKMFFDPNMNTSYFNGNIGVGTSSPWAKLSVEGTSALGNQAIAGFFIGTTTKAGPEIPFGFTESRPHGVEDPKPVLVVKLLVPENVLESARSVVEELDPTPPLTQLPLIAKQPPERLIPTLDVVVA